MLTDINPDMMILARESRGIGQTELAKRIGISQGKLSKAEKGTQLLPIDSFLNLCEVLDYPKSFFVQPSCKSPLSHYHYRKRVTIPQKILLKIEANLKVYKNNIDNLLDAIDLPQVDLIEFDSLLSTPEQLAKQIRFKINNIKGPIIDLTGIIEKLGIIVIKTNLLHEKIDGLSTLSDKSTKIIFINEQMSNDRQRFSLAHELGHILMHFDNIPEQYVDIEDEANRFAAELLMPEAEIKNDLRFLTFQKLAILKRRWQVSMKALMYRARALGSIDADHFRNLQINYSKKRMNKNEPIPLEKEEPYILKEIINLHLSELNYTKKELAEILHLNSQDFVNRFLYSEKPKLRIVTKSV